MKEITIEQAIEDFKNFYGQTVLDEMTDEERHALPLVLGDLLGWNKSNGKALLLVGGFLDRTNRKRWLSEFSIYQHVAHMRTTLADFGLE